MRCTGPAARVGEGSSIGSDATTAGDASRLEASCPLPAAYVSPVVAAANSRATVTRKFFNMNKSGATAGFVGAGLGNVGEKGDPLRGLR